MPPLIDNNLLPGLIGGLVTLAVLVLVSRHRPGPGWRYLVAIGIGVTVWCFAQVAWALASVPAAFLLIAPIQYAAVVSVPVLWLLHALVQTGQRQLLGSYWLQSLWLVPAGTVLLAVDFAIGEGGNILWRELVLPQEAGIARLRNGPWAWLAMAYGYLVFLAGCGVLLRYFAQSSRYWVEMSVTALAPVAVLGLNLAHINGLWIAPMDPTPFGLGVTCLAFAWALVRRRMFQLSPIGRSVALQYLQDGVVIVGPEGQVLEVNPAAGQLGFVDGARLPGPVRELVDRDGRGSDEPEELELTSATQGLRRVQVLARHIEGRYGETAGTVLTLRDVTRERQAQQELLAAHHRLRRMNSELAEMAQTDPLTGLANRRRLMERLTEEYARVQRHGGTLALLLIDLDHFKNVNDRYGHVVGDLALQATAGAIRAMTRPNDLAARFGGEEFVLLLPDTDAAGARSASCRLACRIRALEIDTESGAAVTLTASLGLANLDESCTSPTMLLERADGALYRAKEAGRDRIAIARLKGYEIIEPETIATDEASHSAGDS